MAKRKYDKEDPRIPIKLGGKKFEMGRENSTLYTFLGANAMYNHVFIQTSEREDNVTPGTYIFAHTKVYGPMSKLMLKTDFPAVLNMAEPANSDVEAFEMSIERQVGDIEYGVPEDWLPEA